VEPSSGEDSMSSFIDQTDVNPGSRATQSDDDFIVHDSSSGFSDSDSDSKTPATRKGGKQPKQRGRKRLASSRSGEALVSSPGKPAQPPPAVRRPLPLHPPALRRNPQPSINRPFFLLFLVGWLVGWLVQTTPSPLRASRRQRERQQQQQRSSSGAQSLYRGKLSLAERLHLIGVAPLHDEDDEEGGENCADDDDDAAADDDGHDFVVADDDEQVVSDNIRCRCGAHRDDGYAGLWIQCCNELCRM
jgi:hypothetical protein